MAEIDCQGQFLFTNGSARARTATGLTRGPLGTKTKLIRNDADYETGLRELERLWGAKEGTPEGDRLDVLTTLLEAYEEKHFPVDAPDPIEAIKCAASGGFRSR